MSKTDGICLNLAGHRLDEDPVPILYIGPTKSNIDNVIEPRIAQMFKSCESLSKKHVKGKKTKKLVKQVNGVTFRMAWAGSPTELASQPAAIVLIDEVDRMASLEGEGDVVVLAEARTSTYPDFLIVLDSSPTIGAVETYIHDETGIEHWKPGARDDIQSPIWWYWQEGTREEWAVPCLFCHRHFIPRYKYLFYPEGCTPTEALIRARLVCPKCGSEHFEHHKAEMNRRGTFLAPGQFVDEFGKKQGELPVNDNHSFWVSGLMSPWVSFGQTSSRLIRALESGESGKIQAVFNTRFGELFKVKGEAPLWETVRRCTSGREIQTLFPWCQRLFMTVDVQKSALIWNIRQWGAGYMSALYDEGVISGETDQNGVWDSLEELIQRNFGGKTLDAVAIDSGFRATQVYEFCTKHSHLCRATKGVEGTKKLYQANDIEVDFEGKKSILSIKLWSVDSGYFKTWVHDRIKNENKKGISWWVADNVSEDYCRQLVAENKIVLANGKVKWVRVNRNNHNLDNEALQVFLAFVTDVRYLTPLEAEATPKKKTMAQRAAELNG